MMKKKRILILGAGISGLAAAFTLAKKTDEYDCVLLEQKLFAGGYIETEELDGFTLEKGPRVFKTSRNREFLQLIEEVGFSSEIISSSKASKGRYLWLNGSLQKLPSSLFSLITASLARPLLISLLKEWRIPAVMDDETIWDFACRRFGKSVAERFFDPLVLGIYAGDIKKLSIEACFPILKELERKKGSITLGLLASLFKNKKKPLSLNAPASSLFSFRRGTSSFIKQLVSKIPFPIHYGQEILSLEKKGDLFQVKCSHGVFEGDEVIIALPACVAGALLKPQNEELFMRLSNIPYQAITSVNVAFDAEVLPISAFGYLIPKIEKEEVLGVLFNSKIFPGQHSFPHTTMTLMIEGTDRSDEELLSIVDLVLKVHLKIKSIPKVISWKKMPKAIPQYHLGHLENVEAIESLVPEGVRLVGNYLKGVSVNDCIRLSVSSHLKR